MTKEELKAAISTAIPSVSFPEINSALLNLSCAPADLKPVIRILRDSQNLKFDYLFSLTALDWPSEMEVIYHLRSTTLNHEVVQRVKTDGRENPVIPSITELYAGAEFHEREVYDLFGIVFEGHPDLRRIFLEDDWTGYPLRKDYSDEINIVEL